MRRMMRVKKKKTPRITIAFVKAGILDEPTWREKMVQSHLRPDY
jgi:hypothetical protein